MAEVQAASADSAVSGVLVQLPLPAHISEAAVIAAIAPHKDVDGFTPVNAGRMLLGQPCFCLLYTSPAERRPRPTRCWRWCWSAATPPARI